MNEYGLKGAREEWTGAVSPNRILNHLKEGKPVILNIGGTLVLNDGTSNDYSAYGHFITLLGLDSNGNVFVGDPYGGDNYTKMKNICNSGPKGFYLVDKK